ncbi:MAG: dTDP-4-dehydrorhamnose reductase [Pelotomaculum sp. PtaB.Bin104]|nr:MAG: dTDP-4-dehydrorhamnose reductase [Pelotomaculum sp. PtaB.Bin104]
MIVLVTGARGMLGGQVVLEYQKRGAEVYGLSRQELDITNCEQTYTTIKKIKPEIVINCAAYTNVDGAEEEKEKAFLINGLGPRYLSLACRQFGSTLVHISTDYIFNGQANRPYQIYDTPCPINVYGASKLFGEAAVRETGGRFFIARTSWLFGPGGKNFIDTILSLARQKDELNVVNDQQGSPTYTVDLAGALADLAASKIYGTYHTTNNGAATWYGLAKKVVATAGLKTVVNPCGTKDFPRPAPRPAYSVMNPFPLKKVIGYNLPDWEDAVERYMKEII